MTIKRPRLGSITSLQKQAKNSLLGPVQIPLGKDKIRPSLIVSINRLMYPHTYVHCIYWFKIHVHVGHQVMLC